MPARGNGRAPGDTVRFIRQWSSLGPEWRQEERKAVGVTSLRPGASSRVWLDCLWESSSAVSTVVISIIHPHTGFHPFGFTFLAPTPNSHMPSKRPTAPTQHSATLSQCLCQLKHIKIHAHAEKQNCCSMVKYKPIFCWETYHHIRIPLKWWSLEILTPSKATLVFPSQRSKRLGGRFLYKASILGKCLLLFLILLWHFCLSSLKGFCSSPHSVLL